MIVFVTALIESRITTNIKLHFIRRYMLIYNIRIHAYQYLISSNTSAT